MSANVSGDTGRVPNASEDVFRNVNMGNDVNSPANVNASVNGATVNAPPMNNAPSYDNAVENDTNSPLGEGETVATEEPAGDIATAEPYAPSAAPVSMSKSGKPLSAAQSDLQRLRSETLEDMRQKYAERFGNSSLYPKPPKAKAYHASGLTSIRQRDGESAYQAALKDIMDKNDPMLGTNGVSQMSLTRKSKKPRANVSANVRNNSARMNVANSGRMNAVSAANSSVNRGAMNTMIASVNEMGTTAKQLIDAMMNTNRIITQQLSKTNSAASISQLSNTVANITQKAKKPRVRASRKRAPLSAVPEETSANVANGTM